MKNVKLAYFSPTGTTKQVLQAIAKGITASPTTEIDLTAPESRNKVLQTTPGDLLLIAVPVYMGRVPALLSDWLNKLQADRTPAVCIVVYGNRAYEDALLELSDVIQDRGGIPIACGAFIGEHSFSSSKLPTAHARPDAKDLQYAQEFGQQIRSKIQSLSVSNKTGETKIPGNKPYGGLTKLWDVDFIAVSDQCTQCSLCAESCPTSAIAPNDSTDIDIEKCITCCACIKKCPQSARSMKPSPVLEAAKRLNNLFSARKEPEIFL